MPALFDKCVAGGGKVTTKVIKANVNYMHICWPKGGGTSVAGEVKTYKKLSSANKRTKT